ncbi:MAG: hypothetical protein KIT87_05025 [Anaerolineae bacterium]|nr:hypothetical protein [Anaerolineae bacterium]
MDELQNAGQATLDALPQSSIINHHSFLDRADALAAIHRQISGCRRCAEAGFFVGAPVVAGQWAARVMLVGQAPSEAGAQYNRPFAWHAGRPRPRIWDWLAEVGWAEDEFRALAYLTPVTKCYPGRAASGSGDRRPSLTEVKLCAPYLDRELALVDPDLIITVGTLALERLVGRVRLDDMVGQALTADIAGRRRTLVPLPHPSGVSRWLNEPANQAKLRQALQTLREVRVELGV